MRDTLNITLHIAPNYNEFLYKCDSCSIKAEDTVLQKPDFKDYP